jgi:hypothetical protein
MPFPCTKNPRPTGCPAGFLIWPAVENTFTAHAHNSDFSRGRSFGVVVCHSALVTTKLALCSLSATVARAHFKWIVLDVQHISINKVFYFTIKQHYFLFLKHIFDIIKVSDCVTDSSILFHRARINRRKASKRINTEGLRRPLKRVQNLATPFIQPHNVGLRLPNTVSQFTSNTTVTTTLLRLEPQHLQRRE